MSQVAGDTASGSRLIIRFIVRQIHPAERAWISGRRVCDEATKTLTYGGYEHCKSTSGFYKLLLCLALLLFTYLNLSLNVRGL